MTIIPYLSITVICYGAVEVAKRSQVVKDNWLPVLSVLIGCVCGAVAIISGIDIGATNVLDAIAVSIASGLSAVGIDQIPKQLTK
jgi:hypothetical protein